MICAERGEAVSSRTDQITTAIIRHLMNPKRVMGGAGRMRSDRREHAVQSMNAREAIILRKNNVSISEQRSNYSAKAVRKVMW